MAVKVNDALRAQYTEIVREAMNKLGEDVLTVGSNVLAFPVVDSEGNDSWIKLTITVPTGPRDEGGWDGYGEAQAYEMKQAEKAAKAKLAAEAKAKKIARDQKARSEKKA